MRGGRLFARMLSRFGNQLLSNGRISKGRVNQTVSRQIGPYGQALWPTYGQALWPTYGQALWPTYGQALWPTYGQALWLTYGQALWPT